MSDEARNVLRIPPPPIHTHTPKTSVCADVLSLMCHHVQYHGAVFLFFFRFKHICIFVVHRSAFAERSDWLSQVLCGKSGRSSGFRAYNAKAVNPNSPSSCHTMDKFCLDRSVENLILLEIINL